MAKNGPDWEGLLKWSLANSDSTLPARNHSEEDRKWFMEAIQAQSVDVVKRMKEITLVMKIPEQVLESQGITTEQIQDMLDELQGHVESIDMANDIHSIGGLVPLLGYLKNSHAGIRAKSAEVVTTIVQNNPKSQQHVMEANGFEPLFSNFTSDPDLVARTKALGAISSLIRNNKPGIIAFRLSNGYGALRDALCSDCVKFQRKALNLIHYLLREYISDRKILTELGFPRILLHLATSNDSGVREASLQDLLDISQHDWPSQDDREKFKRVLGERIESISLMSADDLVAAKEERQLLDSLWTAWFDEPSSLREKGLLVLPEERTDADPIAPDDKPNEKKKMPPLLLGLGPSI